MAMKVAVDQFDRRKPFHPLIVVYVGALHGIKDLGLRMVLDEAHRAHGTPTINHFLSSLKTGNAELDAGIKKLREPLELRAECIGASVRTHSETVAREIAYEGQTVFSAVLPTLGSVLMLAHEIVKAQLPGQHDPILEFLFHSRNAVAHGGRWHFINGHPKHPASWRPFTLNVSMHGQPLFKTRSSVGTLGPGDPIRLLWDIEQAYPGLKA